ncbi:MAG: hypothetical protein ACUVTQ_07140 [Desulfotomaculales bacterium]
MIVELRSTGAQTVFPPSRHPSGEEVTWERTGEPARVEPTELTKACATLAAATLLAAKWPGKGSRQDAALALAGGLLRAGWGEEDAARFIAAVARAANDEETAKRAEAAEYTARRLSENGPATGWTRLAEFVGGDVVRKVREWLQVIPEPEPAIPTVALESVKPFPLEALPAGLVDPLAKRPRPRGARRNSSRCRR